MKRFRYSQLLVVVFTALCCRDKIFVADEYWGDNSRDDSTTIKEFNTETTEVDLDTDIDTDTDTETEIETETDTDTDPGTETAPDTETDTAPIEDTDTIVSCGLPTEFSWRSSDPLVLASSDDASIKDPTVVLFNDIEETWLVYVTTIIGRELSIAFLSFTDWGQAGAAEQTPMSSNEDFSGYMAAPQLFYFAPQDLWYLVYQTPEPSYSYTKDPTDVSSWSAPTQFMPMPSIVTNEGKDSIDYWVICDDNDCYMFFSANNCKLYRVQTTREEFPNGFKENTTEMIMEDDPSSMRLFNSCNVYKLAGMNQYLLLVLAMNGVQRYYQSWTSDRLNGSWTRLADTEFNSFASIHNVTNADWVEGGIEHGEMLRRNPDETMTIDTCNMQYLFTGLKASEADPESQYYCLGLLTPAK